MDEIRARVVGTGGGGDDRAIDSGDMPYRVTRADGGEMSSRVTTSANRVRIRRIECVPTQPDE